MNKKRIIFSLGLAVVLSLLNCKSTTTPDESGELATYVGSLRITGIHDSGNATMTFTFEYELINTNNLGSDVSSVVHTLYYQNTVVSEQTYYPATSVRIPAAEKNSWELTEEYDYKNYLPDEGVVVITLTDDNGNEQTFSTGSVAILWTMI